MNMLERALPYFGLGALVIGGVALTLSSEIITELTSPAIASVPAPTLAIVPNLTPSPITLPDIRPEVATTSAPLAPPTVKKPAPRVAAPVATPVAEPQPVITIAVPPAPIATPTPLITQPIEEPKGLEAALVNITCNAPLSSGLRSITASGVVITASGLILTNAHVAQYLLLTDRGVSCTALEGASVRRSVALVYLPSAWARSNATVLTESQPRGTGEYDFAFVALPAGEHRFIPLSGSAPAERARVTIGARSGSFPVVITGSVKSVFTFELNSVDVIELGASTLAHQGSSGGGVADESGTLIATLTTAVQDKALSAITAAYIRRVYRELENESLDTLLERSPVVSIEAFKTRTPTLEAMVTAQLR
jgi:hypothetical protein